MKKILMFSCLLYTLPQISYSDVPAKQVKEVSHLMSFIQNSKCTMNRNGKEHSTEKSLSHIKRKYKHYKDDIKSTEDFIRLAATKSTFSGKAYTIKCSDQDVIKSQDWLLSELESYRKK